jgi:hypothetical protein
VKLAKDSDYVVLAPEKSISAIVPKSLDPTKLERVIEVPAQAEAPVRQGESFGTLTLKDGDTVYGKLQLVALSGAERSGFLYALSVVGKTMKEPVVVKGIGIFIAVVIVYIALMIAVNTWGKKHRRRRRRKNAAKAQEAKRGRAK